MAILKAYLSRDLAYSLGGLVVGICAMTIAQTQLPPISSSDPELKRLIALAETAKQLNRKVDLQHAANLKTLVDAEKIHVEKKTKLRETTTALTNANNYLSSLSDRLKSATDERASGKGTTTEASRTGELQKLKDDVSSTKAARDTAEEAMKAAQKAADKAQAAVNTAQNAVDASVKDSRAAGNERCIPCDKLAEYVATHAESSRQAATETDYR